MFKFGAALIVGVILSGTQIAAAGEPASNGLWKTTSGKLTVKVENCYGGKICARVAGLAKPLRDDGSPKLDENNPNPSLRNRPVIGIMVMDGMTPTGPNSWKGKIYNADDGHTYSAFAKINGSSLRVKGCWGPFCKNIDFVRVN